MVIDIQTNRVTAGIFSYVMTINFVSSYTTTGAFEIYIDDKLEFSKLEKDLLPNAK